MSPNPDPPARPTVVCDGCRKRDTHRIDWRLGPARSLSLCRQVGPDEPLAACLGKALLRAWRCPGCNDHFARTGALCDLCAGRLTEALAAERLAEGGDGRRPRLVDVGEFLSGPGWGGVGDEAPATRVAQLLATLLGGEFLVHLFDHPHLERLPRTAWVTTPRRDRDPQMLHNGLVATLDGKGAAAMKSLLAILAGATRTARAEGYAEGDNALRRLAKGDLSILDFEHERDRKGEPT